MMEQVNFIEQLKELISQENLVAVSREVNELKSKFEDYVLEEERKVQVAQIEALEKGESAPEAESDFGKEAFYHLYNEYREKKKKIVDEKPKNDKPSNKTELFEKYCQRVEGIRVVQDDGSNRIFDYPETGREPRYGKGL